jgi:hypothetical protein
MDTCMNTMPAGRLVGSPGTSGTENPGYNSLVLEGVIGGLDTLLEIARNEYKPA